MNRIKEIEYELKEHGDLADVSASDTKYLLEQLQKCREALAKVSDPRKRDHREPDTYTELGCVMHIAEQCLIDVWGTEND